MKDRTVCILNTTPIYKTCLFVGFLLFWMSACGSPPSYQALSKDAADLLPDTSDTDASADAGNQVDSGSLADAGNQADSGSKSDTDNQADAAVKADINPPDVPPIPPQITLISVPDIFTSETTATFTFECNQPNCTFECSLNDSYDACESPMIYESLNDAEFTFTLRAFNPNEDVSPEVQHTWTVDTQAPQIQNLTVPTPYTNQKSAEFQFDCNETDCTFECALNSTDFEPCSAPASYEDLPDASHSFSVRATDLAGNTGNTATSEWTIDTVAPKVTVTPDPGNRPYFSTAAFAFTCDKPDCTFACSIDAGATFQACTSPQTYENLDRKSQTFTVRATDLATNTALSTPHTWTVSWPKWTKVAVGAQHACGILDDDTLWCWGSPELNASIQILGHPTITSSEVPIQVESASDWQYISANATAVCGIRNSRLYCWGALLVTGEAQPDSVLYSYSGTNWTSISVSTGLHFCGIRNHDQLWCWGLNNQGQVGNGGATANHPVRIGTDAWRSVATGTHHSCGVTFVNRRLHCWGSIAYGQTGQSTLASTPAPVFPYTNQYEIVYTGDYHTLAVSSSNTGYGFGKNGSGELGIGNYTEKIFGPTQTGVNGPTDFAGGADFSCALGEDKKVYCTGANEVGQLGRGNITVRHNTFASIKAPNTLFTQVDAAKKQACALDTDGNIWCWGNKAENSTPTKIPWPY